MSRRGKREADVILGAFARRDPTDEVRQQLRCKDAEVIAFAPYLAARRGHPSSTPTKPA
ncbi:hypothetical protein [Sporichthya sp.]|uniref:hypothetical protein n=1 Tax=Sporichthya sp. TaxID=65475 RepID=UPI00182C9A76|nr:hypothetical protein [Sporichthya sp.]MBA3741604.1 hypothetical protein [Sporichthya sp.]